MISVAIAIIALVIGSYFLWLAWEAKHARPDPDDPAIKRLYEKYLRGEDPLDPRD